ncbi:MAG: CBS domain-containing protein [Candidatus Omnitrophica bacterium]|nr:CBS domain-containing protein [Candidatus Omnitrophota bacterium]
MLAKDIMTTQVLTVLPSILIKDAIKLLVEIEISGLIVTDENNEIFGVLSGKDLIVAYDFLGQVKAPIRDYVNRDVISVPQDTPIKEISHILIQKNILRVPIVEDKKVLGVVSRRDILRYILNQVQSHTD